MANPLKRNTPGPPTDDDSQLDACHRHNLWARRVGMSRWHYLEPEKPGIIMSVDGAGAEEVWKVLDGGHIDYVGWPREKIDKLERRCRWLIKQGTHSPGEVARPLVPTAPWKCPDWLKRYNAKVAEGSAPAKMDAPKDKAA